MNSVPSHQSAELANQDTMWVDPTDAPRLLDFVKRWYRYGGGSEEDIFCLFGVAPAEYFARVDYVLARTRPTPVMPEREITAIREVCRRRLKDPPPAANC